MSINFHYTRVALKAKEQNLSVSSHFLYIAITEQTLYWYQEKILHAHYPISTSKAPPSCIENSFGTPLGLHKIAEKIGAGAKPGTVFKSRKSTGKTYQEKSEPQNLITSRILRLQGLETGYNRGPGCDSFSRYIYLHGTNREDLIGRPHSLGCIELKNADVITLFATIPIDSLVLLDLLDKNELRFSNSVPY